MKKKPFNVQDSEYIARIEKRLTTTKLVNQFSPPEPDDVVIMGSFSRTWRNKPYREIIEGKTDIVNDRVDSPIAHARDYLLACYSRRPAQAKVKEILRRKEMPIYVYPCLMYDATYIDIRGAWWNIMRGVGWNCEYYPGMWLGPGQSPEDFPLPTNKVARSSLITIARSSIIPVWKRGIVKQERIYNKTENLHIWGITADLLNSIARIAIELFDCRYVATDGFIIPSRHSEALQSFISTLGLDTREKWRGPCIVAGAGSYMADGHISLRSATFRGIDNIDRTTDIDWVLKKWTYCNSVTKTL